MTLYKATKRIFDLFCAVVGILLSSPLWIIITIGIKVSSKGPIFYKTERVGLNNSCFIMYKFRSMHLYKPETKKGNKKSEGGYIANPQRMFAFGRFLRKSKLDELPQLLNVLLSQMSIVGPRPVSKASAEENYTGDYSCILSVKPGLACLDSLYDYAHGELFVSSNEEYIKKVLPVRTELAKLYVEKQGVFLDLYIIFRTIYLICSIIIAKKKEFKYTKYEKIAIDTVSLQSVSINDYSETTGIYLRV